MQQRKILIINGPNLNMLGTREPKIYGHKTLKNLENDLKEKFSQKNILFTFIQSNYEGVLLETIQQTIHQDYCGVVINAGALTHTSIALRDAFSAVSVPFIEVHISNVFTREPFRHHSYLSDIAKVVISGAGFDGYHYAVDYFINNT
jgi:3-dehydroquinate dehydratase-2